MDAYLQHSFCRVVTRAVSYTAAEYVRFERELAPDAMGALKPEPPRVCKIKNKPSTVFGFGGPPGSPVLFSLITQLLFRCPSCISPRRGGTHNSKNPTILRSHLLCLGILSISCYAS